MKILITGASGFVGSWLSRLLSDTHDVTCLLRENSSSYRLEGISRITLIHAREDSWEEMVRMLRPDILILADWWGVENSYRNDKRQFLNLDRFKSLVDIAIDTKVSQIIGVGSQAELGPVGNKVYETQGDNPTTLYGEAKVQARKYLLNLSSKSTRTTWMRIFSTYGALDTGDWLIPNTIRKLSQNKPMELTKGEQQWSYLYISDLVEAFSICIEKGQSGVVNVGNPATIRIEDAVLEIGKQLEKQQLLKFGVIPYRRDQVMLMIPVCETLIELGWTPKIEYSAGILETIKWMSGGETPTLRNLGIPRFMK